MQGGLTNIACKNRGGVIKCLHPSHHRVTEKKKTNIYVKAERKRLNTRREVLKITEKRGIETAGNKQYSGELTEKIIGCAIEVHRVLGPGLLESAYEECLCRELAVQGIEFERQVSLPVEYKGVKLDCGYRMDIVVEKSVVVEVKTVEKLLPLHEAQLLTYLKLSGIRRGLLLNFNTAVLRSGIKRLMN